MRVKPTLCCQVSAGVRITVLLMDSTWLPALNVLPEAEQRSDGANGIGSGVLLNVILGRQAVLVVHHVIDVGDSLVRRSLSHSAPCSTAS